MADLIIYPSSDRPGGICLVTPTDLLPLEEVAKRDLPAGVPYKLVNNTDLPADHDFFNAWEADFTEPDGYALGIEEWTAQNPNYVFEEQ